MNFFEFMKKYPNEVEVIKDYIKIRYNKKVKCNHCGSEKVSQYTDRPKFFQCNACNNTFSIFKDTIFEKTTTDLRKWMYAIHLMLNSKKGISGLQLKREIGVTYKTAWRMLQQIRKAMGNIENKKAFKTIIEIDETYIGGKPRKPNKRDDDINFKNKRGRGTKKTPVIGILDRKNHIVYAKVALSNKKGKKLSGNQLLGILNEIAKEKSIVVSDEFPGYNILKKKEYIHLVVDHTKEFVNEYVHTNNIESFWAILKRGIYGIYHHISLEYMQRYIDEFCFRYNNKDCDMFNLILKQSILKLSYL